MHRVKRLTRILFLLLFSTMLTITSCPTHADIPWDSNFDANAEDDHATLGGSVAGNESTPQNTPGTDGGTYQPPSGSGEPLPEGTSALPNPALDYAIGYHCEHPVTYKIGEVGLSIFWRCDDPPPSDTTSSTPPSTRTILRRAAAIIHADGAGINKQPPTVSYTNRFIPTIVSVTKPTQTHAVTLFGREVTVTFTAMSYEWNWGDGTPNTVTTSPGLAWHKGIDPNKDPRLIRHYYTPPQGWRSGFDGPYPHENREITLRTTWSGTATNPFTGETQTINGLVRACQFFCVWGLEVGGDSVGVGGGELGEGLFPVGGGVSLDEAGVSCSFVGGFAGVCLALGGSFVFDVADGEP